MGDVNLAPAFEANLLWGAVAGMIGAVVIAILLYVIKVSGEDLDLPYILGSYFVDIGNKTKLYITGIILHIIIGGIWGMIYILTLAAMGVHPEWSWAAGFLWGFAHGIIVGVMMSTITQTHPNMGEGKAIPDPGILGSRWSAVMPYIVLGIHIVFGIVTLLSYQLLFSAD